MNCPLCIDQTLDAFHRQGIELDICPKCRGIWLDRGELDRLIAEPPPPSPRSTASHRPDSSRRDADRDDDDRYDNDRDDDDRKRSKSKKKRKKSISARIGDVLEEVLDELT